MSKLKELFRFSVSLIFLLAVLLQTFSKDFVVLDYYINTDSYAKNCVNKEKPKLQCKGKCQMMKKAKEEEKKEQDKPSGRERNKRDIFLSSKSFSPSLPSVYSLKTSQIYSQKLNVILNDCIYGIFHPPRA
jgi:hypothetical protein